jgi:hypothetical protein
MNQATATHYLTRKVAQIIYDTVECCHDDRALTDWLAAERIVSEHFGWMISRMLGETREAEHWILPDDAAFDEFDRKLGGYVWSNTQSERRHLPRPPYGRITFA